MHIKKTSLLEFYSFCDNDFLLLESHSCFSRRGVPCAAAILTASPTRSAQSIGSRPTEPVAPMSPVGPPQSSGACSSSSEDDSDSESDSESSSEESGDEASHEPVDSARGNAAPQAHLSPQTMEPMEETKPQDRWNLERFLKRETQSLGGEQPVESEHSTLCKVSSPFVYLW
jgi:hypothetical protein